MAAEPPPSSGRSAAGGLPHSCAFPLLRSDDHRNRASAGNSCAAFSRITLNSPCSRLSRQVVRYSRVSRCFHDKNPWRIGLGDRGFVRRIVLFARVTVSARRGVRSPVSLIWVARARPMCTTPWRPWNGLTPGKSNRPTTSPQRDPGTASICSSPWTGRMSASGCDENRRPSPARPKMVLRRGRSARRTPTRTVGHASCGRRGRTDR